MPDATNTHAHRRFHGAAVVRAAFVLAILGWGVGFYGPAIFMQAVVARTGWTVPLVSGAVTLHFLLGAVVVVQLPRMHHHWGVPITTTLGASSLALGVIGWAFARTPSALFLAAAFSGAGWVCMGAAAINAMISPWFVRTRTRALATAYNGASMGGVIFSPLWSIAISTWGFRVAAVLVGAIMLPVVAWLSMRVLAPSPASLGQHPDGDRLQDAAHSVSSARTQPAAGKALWRNRQFLTLAAGMALGLFAQIGLLAHLYTLLVPSLGGSVAGVVMGLATACAIGGRTLLARNMPANADRRMLACVNYGVQAGGVLLLTTVPDTLALVLLGIALFGAGLGNATSLPPLIAQAEFAPNDVPRVVALIVAIAQAFYALAPAAFALLLNANGDPLPGLGNHTVMFFGAAISVQLLAMACLWHGRPRRLNAATWR
jgi:MFS family permease